MKEGGLMDKAKESFRASGFLPGNGWVLNVDPTQRLTSRSFQSDAVKKIP